MSVAPLHFNRLQLRRMPGVEDGGFAVEGLSAGINVIYGPNGCGKSRTAAAINALLWPETVPARRASVAGALALDGDEWLIDLDAGSVRYQRGGVEVGRPQLPPSDAADRYNLPLHDLLRDDAGNFTQAILRESAGGYDVKAAAEILGAREAPSRPKKDEDAQRAAAQALKEAQSAQAATLEEEQTLAALEAELDRAEEAAARVDLLGKAILLDDARAALAQAEAALASFPPGVARLRGDELESLDTLQRNLREAADARDAARDELAKAEKERAGCGLPANGLPPDLLATLGARQKRIATLRAALDAASRDHVAADAERAKARARIAPGITDAQLARLDAGGVAQLALLAAEAAGVRGEAYAEDQVAKWIGAPAPAVDLDRMYRGFWSLWRWLQAPPAPAGAPVDGASHVWLAVACGLVVVEAAILAVAVRWWLAFVAVAGTVIFALALRRRGATAPANDAAAAARAFHAAEFEKLGLPRPPRWQDADVAAYADLLAEQWAKGQVDREKANRFAALEPRREELRTRLAALAAKRNSIVQRVGVEPGDGDAGAVMLAANLAAWQVADARLAAAEAAYARAIEQHDDEVQNAAALVLAYGCAAGDLPEVEAAAERLKDRQKKFEIATANRDNATRSLAQAERRMESAAANVSALYGRLGLAGADEDTLRRWCDQRGAYARARDAAAQAALELKHLDAALAPEPSLRTSSRAGVESELRDAEEMARNAASVRRQVADIRARVDAAKKGADMEEALSRNAECLGRLATRREEDCRGVATWLLADSLRRDARDRDRPGVFHRARALFSRVTQGRYRLDFDDADPPSFRATDTSTGVGHPLDELSGGTRLQLLLAVRVAFVEEQERGVKLPILLDETLANSDEQRARAIIDATLAIARSGRQVFYFTAQHDEVAKWKAVLESEGDVPHRLIDLAEVRGLAATERLPLREITPPAGPRVPEPVGLSREQYAALLQVPAFDPSRPEVGGTHLWHLIENQAVLHRFLKLGINTWGQLKNLGGSSVDALVDGSADAYRAAGAGAKALHAMAEAWRVGRGRPVDRQAVLDSGAVTDTFTEAVCSLTDALGGDAAKLIEALEDGKVKGFRGKATSTLRAYFCEHGYIDERPPLSREQVRSRMLAAAAAEIGQRTFDPGRIDAFLAECYQNGDGAPGADAG